MAAGIYASVAKEHHKEIQGALERLAKIIPIVSCSDCGSLMILFADRVRMRLKEYICSGCGEVKVLPYEEN